MIRSLIATLALTAALVAADPVAPGTAAPAFTLPSATGSAVSLASLTGKTVVLEWTNYDCPFVKKFYVGGAMPALQAKWTAQGVVWLSINSSAPGKHGHLTGEALTSRIAAEKAVPSHFLVDSDGTVGKAYGATTTPQMVVIDGKGTVVYHGAIDSIRSTDAADVAKATNYVDAALTELAAGKPVTTPKTKSYGCGVKY